MMPVRVSEYPQTYVGGAGGGDGDKEGEGRRLLSASTGISTSFDKGCGAFAGATFCTGTAVPLGFDGLLRRGINSSSSGEGSLAEVSSSTSVVSTEESPGSVVTMTTSDSCTYARRRFHLQTQVHISRHPANFRVSIPASHTSRHVPHRMPVACPIPSLYLPTPLCSPPEFQEAFHRLRKPAWLQNN